MIHLSSEDRKTLLTKGLSQAKLKEIFEDDDIPFFLEMAQVQGLSLVQNNQNYFAKQQHSPIKDLIFCVVDIETNGSKHGPDQIIEIGAYLIQNNEIIDSFNSLLYANRISPSISELTGIKAVDLINAPSFKEVLHAFRLFIKDSIIVAHPLKFDYEFISYSFNSIGIGEMLNLSLCNISLAERTLSSAKYGLKYLNASLELQEEFQQHRALNDAKITLEIFKKALENLPKEIKDMNDLLRFSKEGKKQARAALKVFDS